MNRRKDTRNGIVQNITTKSFIWTRLFSGIKATPKRLTRSRITGEDIYDLN